MTESGRHVLEAAGIRWTVWIHGSGPPLLAVHGTGSTSHSFEPLARELPHTVIAPDLPGHGGSSRDSGSGPALPAFAAGLVALLDRLGHAPTVAIGHSAGAAVIGWMALEGWIAPRLCVGLGAALVPFEPRRQTMAKLGARLLADSGLGRGLARLAPVLGRLAPSEGLEPEQADAYRRLAADPDHVDGVLHMLARWDAAPLFERLHELESPWLLLAGADDAVVPAHHQRLAASRMRAARLALLAGGHLVHEADPIAVAREIAAEIASLHTIV